MKKYKREYFGKTLKTFCPVFFKNKLFDCSILDDNESYHVLVYNENSDWWNPSRYEIIDNLGKIKCNNMGTYCDQKIEKYSGSELKSIISNNHTVTNKDGEWVYSKDLEEEKIYNVQVTEFDDSEGWNYERYKILDDIVNVVKTSPEPCNKKKQVYQLIICYNEDMCRKKFYEYMCDELDAIHLSSTCFWFVSELTPTELCDKIKPLVTNDNGEGDTFYVMEMSKNMNCWLGSNYVDWFRDKMGMESLNKNTNIEGV